MVESMGMEWNMPADWLAVVAQTNGHTPWFSYVIHIAYTIILSLIVLFGAHRWYIVWLYYRNRQNIKWCDRCFRELPTVTIQLPMYNELYVARRVIEAAAAIDYPREKLQIQVLDDSTDQTRQIAAQTVRQLADAGHRIEYLHRSNREGFKAGALAAGLESATGELVMIFDADFVPPARILHDMVHYFTNEKVGMVQARWDHINRTHSTLTQAQAIFLDAHFVIEHTARNTSGRFMNFNGTAGIWRRSAIDDAGGWEHDTLTEDMDLSYRAQLRGWEFVYLPHITAPAELPPEVQGFKQQQFRWTKGTVQTAGKMLPQIFKSGVPAAIKTEAFFHLVNPVAYLLMSVLILMFGPLYFWQLQHAWTGWVLPFLLGCGLIFLASGSATAFYMCSQRELGGNWKDKIKYLPLLMGIGVGVALNNSLAVLEAFFGKQSPFERTPKFGVEAHHHRNQWRKRTAEFVSRRTIMPTLELFYGIYCLSCLYLYSDQGWSFYVFCPFLLIFAYGYLYVGGLSWRAIIRSWIQEKAEPVRPEPELLGALGEWNSSPDATEIDQPALTRQ